MGQGVQMMQGMQMMQMGRVGRGMSIRASGGEMEGREGAGSGVGGAGIEAS